MFAPRRKLALLAALILCCVLTDKATPALHRLRGEPVVASTPLARGLFQKTLFRNWPLNEASRACEGDLVAAATKPTVDYLASVPADIRPYLYEAISAHLRFSVILPKLVEKHGFARFSDPDPILLCYTTTIMKMDPLYFVHGAVEQFWRLLTYATFVSPERRERMVAFLDAHPLVLPPPVARLDGDLQKQALMIDDLGLKPDVLAGEEARLGIPQARSQLLANGLRTFQGLAAVLLFIGVIRLPFAFIKRPSPVWGVLGTFGIAFFGEACIVSFVEITFPRYIFPLWPLLSASLALFFAILWNAFWTHLRTAPIFVSPPPSYDPNT